MLIDVPKATRARPIWPWAALVIALLIAAFAFYNFREFGARGSAPKAADPLSLSGELAHLSMLGEALRHHAEEHDGHYPMAVADIEWRQSKPGMDAGGLPAVASRFHQPGSGTIMDWIYYSGHTVADPAETILVASPVAVGANADHRLVTRIGNVTEVIAESDFQRQTLTTAPTP